MKKWKIAFWIVLTLLVLVTVFSFYEIIDQGVTITYMKDGYSDTESDLNTLIELINETDLSKKEVESVLKNHKHFEFMNFETDTVSLDRILLYFKNDTLDKIEKQW